MGAQQSRDIPENEFVFENPLLSSNTTTSTFELPPSQEEENNKNLEKEKGKVDNKPVSVSTFSTPETKDIEDIENEANTHNFKDEDTETETTNNNDENNINPEKSTNNNDKVESEQDNSVPLTPTPMKEEVKPVKKEKKKIPEEPLPAEDTYKPFTLEKADAILSPEIIEGMIEEHVKEEIYSIKNEQKVKNFKRDKLLERTHDSIKYGNSNVNYKELNDSYRKSQRRVIECMNNNDSGSLSERDIACYQEFEEFKDSIRMLYKKYYNA